MFSFLPRRPSKKSAHPPRFSRLGLEVLESRVMPAVTAVLSGGALTVAGTGSADQIIVREAAGQVVIAGVARSFAVSQISQLQIQAVAGNDLIDVSGVTLP